MLRGQLNIVRAHYELSGLVRYSVDNYMYAEGILMWHALLLERYIYLRSVGGRLATHDNGTTTDR